MITHHVSEATLISYAGGSLGEALSLVTASHLALCPECRLRLRAAAAAGGAMLESVEAAPLREGSLEHMMARLELETERSRRAPPPAPRPEVRDMRLPQPLASRLAVGHLDEIRWRWIGPGVRTHLIDTPKSGGTLRLLKIAPGVAMPEHGHGGTELTLVLAGAYADETGHYGAGDIADLDEEAEHTPKAEAGEDCICLVATEAPTRFKGLVGRLMQPIIGF